MVGAWVDEMSVQWLADRGRGEREQPAAGPPSVLLSWRRASMLVSQAMHYEVKRNPVQEGVDFP